MHYFCKMSLTFPPEVQRCRRLHATTLSTRRGVFKQILIKRMPTYETSKRPSKRIVFIFNYLFAIFNSFDIISAFFPRCPRVLHGVCRNSLNEGLKFKSGRVHRKVTRIILHWCNSWCIILSLDGTGNMYRVIDQIYLRHCKCLTYVSSSRLVITRTSV